MKDFKFDLEPDSDGEDGTMVGSTQIRNIMDIDWTGMKKKLKDEWLTI